MVISHNVPFCASSEPRNLPSLGADDHPQANHDWRPKTLFTSSLLTTTTPFRGSTARSARPPLLGRPAKSFARRPRCGPV